MKYIGYKRKLMFSSKTLGSINNMFAMYDDSIGLVYQLLKISRLCRNLQKNIECAEASLEISRLCRSFSKNILNCAEASRNIQIVQKLLQKYLDFLEASKNIQILQKLFQKYLDCAVALEILRNFSTNILIVQIILEISRLCRSFS